MKCGGIGKTSWPQSVRILCQSPPPVNKQDLIVIIIVYDDDDDDNDDDNDNDDNDGDGDFCGNDDGDDSNADDNEKTMSSVSIPPV